MISEWGWGMGESRCGAVENRYNQSAMKNAVVVSDPEIMHGTPCFRGTRVPFKNLIDYLEGGYSLDEFVDQFPTVSREQAVQALEEAKDSLLAKMFIAPTG